MRALVQRVVRGSVTVDGGEARSIGRGYVILLGVGEGDDEAAAQRLWSKIAKLRIFADEAGKTNLSLADVGGEVLIVSQFTLYASCKKGNRPSFTNAAPPQLGQELYERFVALARRDVPVVVTGEFGADMRVDIANDGPFTIWLDTAEL